MSEILLYYRRPDPTTWVYMSSFLTIGLYFVFHRFWSVRNLDIALLILLAPGLLMVHEGRRREVRALETEQTVAQQKEDSGAAPIDIAPADLQSQHAAGLLPKTILAQVDPSEVKAVLADESAKDADAAAKASAKSPSEADDAPTANLSEEADAPKVQTGGQVLGGPGGAVDAPGINGLDAIADDDAAILPAEETDEDNPLMSAFQKARSLQRQGFIFLFVIQALILIRLLIDPVMSRRPLLNPNLTTGGLYFISISLFVFMMGNIVTSTPRMQVLQGPKLGPGYALMHRLPAITTRPVSDALAGADPRVAAELTPMEQRWTMIAKAMAILAHLAIVSGIVLIGNRHFGNLRAGVGAATLYLMLPYTAQMTGRVDHALPAALLLWAILMYRKPLVAGVFFGLAAGLVYYPLFLLPLWCSFYWRRGVRRFAVGTIATLTVLMLLLSAGGIESMVDHLRLMFGLRAPIRNAEHLQGIWALGWSPIWRLPVIVGFGILCTLFAFWPSPKNLGTLISCTAAVMVAAQFWHGYGGGLYAGWFLPLLLLTIFRPNLQDRVALKVVEPSKRDARTPQPEVQPA